MQDPKPSNITGRKRVTHSVSWEIQVGYLALGIAVLYIAWNLFGGLSSSSADGEDIEIMDTGESDFTRPLAGGSN